MGRGPRLGFNVPPAGTSQTAGGNFTYRWREVSSTAGAKWARDWLPGPQNTPGGRKKTASAIYSTPGGITKTAGSMWDYPRQLQFKPPGVNLGAINISPSHLPPLSKLTLSHYPWNSTQAYFPPLLPTYFRLFKHQIFLPRPHLH